MTDRPESMRQRGDRPDFCRHSERPEACPVCTTCAAEGCNEKATGKLQSPVRTAPLPVCPKHEDAGAWLVKPEFVEKKP